MTEEIMSQEIEKQDIPEQQNAVENIEESTPSESVEANTESKSEGDKPEDKTNKVQSRINQITREKYEFKARADELENQNKALQEQLRQIELQKQNLVKPKIEDFNTLDEYEEAKDQYLLDSAAQKALEQVSNQQKEHIELQQKLARQAEIAQKQATFQSRISEVKANFENFDEVVNSPLVRITNEMAELIMDSEKGPELAYHLGTHLDEADRISRLPVHLQARELVLLESRLQKVAANKVTNAPEPTKPISGKSAQPSNDPSKMTMDEWMAWRQKTKKVF